MRFVWMLCLLSTVSCKRDEVAFPEIVACYQNDVQCFEWLEGDSNLHHSDCKSQLGKSMNNRCDKTNVKFGCMRGNRIYWISTEMKNPQCDSVFFTNY